VGAAALPGSGTRLVLLTILVLLYNVLLCDCGCWWWSNAACTDSWEKFNIDSILIHAIDEQFKSVD
jgi:hypothetical protein